MMMASMETKKIETCLRHQSYLDAAFSFNIDTRNSRFADNWSAFCVVGESYLRCPVSIVQPSLGLVSVCCVGGEFLVAVLLFAGLISLILESLHVFKYRLQRLPLF